MKKDINLLYIDESIELYLANWLRTSAKEFDDLNINYKEVNVEHSGSLVDVILSKDVKQANVIIIGSYSLNKCEAFEVILKSVNPFIKVINISHNSEHKNVIEKFKSYSVKSDEDEYVASINYYNDNLRKHILEAIDSVFDTRRIIKNMKNNKIINNKIFMENIDDLANGITSYSKLTDNEVDELIGSFKNIANEVLK